MEMCLKGCRGRRVVEVDVEEELLIRFWEALAKLALDSTVTRANVVLQDVTDNFTDVFNLGKLGGGPIV